MSSPNQHLAAIIESVGSPLKVINRPTPKPGPSDLLIEAKYIALNPVDCRQRDLGFAIKSCPAIPGSDIAGNVISAGSSVPADAPKPGSRVLAFAPAFYTQGAPDYGGLQARVLVPAENVTPLPEQLGFKEASILPMAVLTIWSGLYSIGVSRDTAYKPEDKKGFLVWGGSGSVGSVAVQIASLMGFKVYATASEKNHHFVKKLGASSVFDYKDDKAVANIVKAAKEDGVTIAHALDAAGAASSCVAILKESKGDAKTAILASAIPLFRNPSPETKGVVVKFILAPNDGKERQEHFHFVFAVWLKENLHKGELVPSPQNIKVVDGGLKSVNEALDELLKGISATKLVMKV
ncbi:hypothetical protein MMC21_006519 [Puttea exsequens]|nr:hypothetical protein [Puttea exsequens]